MQDFIEECEPELRRLLNQEIAKTKKLEREVQRLWRIIYKQIHKRNANQITGKLLRMEAKG